MSHINDLIGIVRGLRLVVEAGAKLQKETTRIKWNNSTFKSLIQTCPTNTFATAKLAPDSTKDILERAFVVFEGFKQYAIMYVPNFNANIEYRPDMDPNYKEEIEELNREFNKTFESLEKEKIKRLSTTPAPFPVNADDIAAANIVHQQPKPRIEVQQSSNTLNSTSTEHNTIPKPVAKKKIRVAVSSKLISRFFCNQYSYKKNYTM